MRQPALYICENKGADQYRRLFRSIDSTINLKFLACSPLLWLYGPGLCRTRKPRKQVFLRRDSLVVSKTYNYRISSAKKQWLMHQSFVAPAPSGPRNSGAFNFSFFKALLKALHCRAKFVVKSPLKAPAPGD